MENEGRLNKGTESIGIKPKPRPNGDKATTNGEDSAPIVDGKSSDDTDK